ncbi:S8 family peptidase [Nocardioides aurantiacus]|uniref:Subtilisin family serine protease n=1 Tax=Nocardioides aurantiacus TaxID=86796 RepID=A0A3N2CYM6_9ACTN|nr:S8 family serine peptidase [Nocardioides aurantiacus]ROR92645.1 subtilisin family serine protease [Nocardioides aurantiacus]
MVVAGARALGLLGAGLLLTGGVAPASGATAPAGDSTSTDTGSEVAAAARKSRPGVWWYDAMRLGDVHEKATGKGVKVAVIDIQLDPYVPDLRGAELSTGTDCLDNKPIKYWRGPLASHGTAMTTAIVGQGAGGKGIVGVAPDAEVRFYSYDQNPQNGGYECDGLLIGRQVDKAIAWGADVINMSLGVGSGLEEPVARALDAGAVVVASSGEVPDGTPRDEQLLELPAGIPGVVAVAAGTSKGTVWSKNPYGDGLPENDWLTVTAPGVDTPLGAFRQDSTWVLAEPRTGTSGASAITAGAFAVLKERWPEATNNQLIQSVLHHTGRKGADGGLAYDKVQGYGTLSLRRALEVDPAGYPDENPLLMKPAEAIEAFPASSYDQDTSGEDATADAAAGPEDSGATSDSAQQAGGADETDQAGQGGAVPWWAVALGAVLLAAVGAGAVLARRRRPTTAPPRPEPGTAVHADHEPTDDRTAPRGS